MTHFRPSRTSATFALPHAMSRCAGWDGRAQAAPRASPLARLIEAVGARWRTAQARRANAADLAAMSDRELADMSINRPDMGRLFDPAFAQEFRSRRAGGRMQAR